MLHPLRPYCFYFGFSIEGQLRKFRVCSTWFRRWQSFHHREQTTLPAPPRWIGSGQPEASPRPASDEPRSSHTASASASALASASAASISFADDELIADREQSTASTPEPPSLAPRACGSPRAAAWPAEPRASSTAPPRAPKTDTERVVMARFEQRKREVRLTT